MAIVKNRTVPSIVVRMFLLGTVILFLCSLGDRYPSTTIGTGLLSDSSEVDAASNTDSRIKHGGFLRRNSDISSAAMWPTTDDRYKTIRRVGPVTVISVSATKGNPVADETLVQNTNSGTWPRTEQLHVFDPSAGDSSAEIDSVIVSDAPGPKYPLGDSSPLQMWPITSEVSDSLSSHSSPPIESETGSTVTSESHVSRRALLRDISPPGMWPPGSDQDEADMNMFQFRRRALLERAPPTPLDNHGFAHGIAGEKQVQGRTLRGRKAISPVEDKSRSRFVGNTELHGRALLGDISPPGMWPISDDQDEFDRRLLLSTPHSPINVESAVGSEQRLHDFRDILHVENHSGIGSVHSSLDIRGADSPVSGEQFLQRQALFRDLSPPQMWPVRDDQPEGDWTRGRFPLSAADSKSLELESSLNQEKHVQRRSLLRDISPPGMWPITDDQDEFVRRSLLSNADPITERESVVSGDCDSQRRVLLHDHDLQHLAESSPVKLVLRRARKGLLRGFPPTNLVSTTSA